MNGILNETTNTVHKQETGAPGLQTPCGITNNVPEDQLSPTAIDQSDGTTDTTRCGRCFEDGGGY